MSSAFFVVLCFAVAGSFAAANAWRARKVRRSLRDAVAIDSRVPEGGFVRVTGHVRIAEGFLHSLLSDRRCVAFIARAVRRDGSTSYEEGRTIPFEIECSDGSRVAIDSEHATIIVPPLPLRPGSEARCEEFARSRKLRKKLHYEEVVVMEDMRISVAGLLMRDASLVPSDTERGFRDGQLPAMRLAGDAKHPIIIGVPVD